MATDCLGWQVHVGPRWLVDYRVALDELATFELIVGA